jgi:hypothetical protein
MWRYAPIKSTDSLTPYMRLLLLHLLPTHNKSGGGTEQSTSEVLASVPRAYVQKVIYDLTEIIPYYFYVSL